MCENYQGVAGKEMGVARSLCFSDRAQAVHSAFGNVFVIFAGLLTRFERCPTL